MSLSNYQIERLYPFPHFSAFKILLFVGVACWYYNEYKYPKHFINIDIKDSTEQQSITSSDFSLSLSGASLQVKYMFRNAPMMAPTSPKM